VEQTFDFAQGNGGWLTDIADYSPATAPSDVITEIRTLPAPLSGSGYYFYGTNRSDDLFIYGKTKVTGLANSVTYRVFVDVEFATDVPSGCVGVGGSPGESVWIVAAASPGEPLTIFNGSDYRVNIDRGNQSQGGGARTGARKYCQFSCRVRHAALGDKDGRHTDIVYIKRHIR
jgi:hypothetical protein